MSLARYVRSNVPAIVWLGVALVLSDFILAVAGVGYAVIVLVSVLVFLGVCGALLSDWMRKRSFYNDLIACADDAEQPLWLTEMIERPDFAEGALTYDALAAITKAANDGVGRYRHQMADYRAYIETWVHEAKSPIAAAHLMLDNVRADSDGPDAGGKLRALDDELQRVEGYIEQALFYARSETVDRDYLIRRYQLSDLVAAAVKANASALISAHMAPVMEHLEYAVFTDEKWIAFILGQILQNAVKYARADGAQLVFRAELCDEGHADERVVLTIWDNGRGVSDADLPRVFDKGFTGANGRAGKQSTGIGLYLVKRLCDKMGVGVSASSEEDSWFAVTLAFSTNQFQYVDRGGGGLNCLL